MPPGFQPTRGAASRSAWGATPSPFAEPEEHEERKGDTSSDFSQQKMSQISSRIAASTDPPNAGLSTIAGNPASSVQTVPFDGEEAPHPQSHAFLQNTSASASSSFSSSASSSSSSSSSSDSSSSSSSSSDVLPVAVASSPRRGSVLLSRFGTPSSGRLLPGVRLLSYDPTVEGCVEAFLAECCDASRQTNPVSRHPESYQSSSSSSSPSLSPSLSSPSSSSASSSSASSSSSSSSSPSSSSSSSSVDPPSRPAPRGFGEETRQELVVSVSVGSLVGKLSGWKVNLPVALETMLEEQVDLDVMFQPWEANGQSRAGVAGDEGRAAPEGERKLSLQRLLQRLLQAKRKAYALRPSRRHYQIVDTLKGDSGGDKSDPQQRRRPQQQGRSDEEAEEGLGAGRVLRYRLVSEADLEEPDEDMVPQGAREEKVGDRIVGETDGNTAATQPAKETGNKGDREVQPAEKKEERGELISEASAVQRDSGAQEKESVNALGARTEAAKLREEHTTAKRNKRGRQPTRVEVVERIPLGARLIYRPRSDNHIRLSAESEIATLYTPRLERSLSKVPKLETQIATSSETDGASGPRSEASAGGEENTEHSSGETACLREEVIQRAWVTQDVWELPPVDWSRQESPHRPRWRLVVTEEGEVADCRTPAPTLLLAGGAWRGRGGKPSRALGQLPGGLGRKAPGVNAAEDAKQDRDAEEHIADDVDRYEETKKVYVHLEICGGALQRQLERRQRGQRNAFGALALLIFENAQVLAKWIDEINGDFGGSGGPFYFPNHMGDVVHAVQKHYNQRRLVSAGRSRIGGLRIHNNQVKRLLINKYVSMGQTVLELACGHGQDMWKYADRCIGKFVGVDVSVAEIREARRRVREGQAARHLLQQMLHPPAFHVGNLVDRRALSFLRSEQFDVVSIQLAIHYMVQTEQQAREVLGRAAAHLKEGGMVLGSTVCCGALADHLIELAFVSEAEEPPETLGADAGQGAGEGEKAIEKCDFGNEVYSVTFDLDTVDKLLQGAPGIDQNWMAARKEKIKAAAGSDPSAWKQYLFADLPVEARAAVGEHLRKRLETEFGVEYHFFLSDAIDAKEFVLPWRSFCAVAASLGLKLMLSMTFPEFLAAAAADPVSERGLKRWLERLNATSRLDKPQFEAFSLYKVFVFKKATASAEKAGAALHRASQGSTASAPSSQLSPLGVPSSTEPQVSQPSADLDAQLSGDVQSEKRLGSGRQAEQAGVYVHPSAQLAGPARGGEQVTLDGSFPADRNALLAGVPLKRKKTKRAQNLNEDL